MTATDVTDLLDEAWGLQRELDDGSPMWEAEVDQLERWFSTSSEHTAAARERCEEMAARLGAAAGDAPVDARASLLTARDMLRLLGAELAVAAELTWPDPEQGIAAYLHWAVPGYDLVTAAHGSRYVDKLHRLPAAVDELRARLEEAAAGDRAPLARHSRRTVEKLDEDLARPLDEDPLLSQDPPRELDADAVAAWREQVAEAVRTSTRPALRRLRDTLADVSVPAGRDDDHPGLLHRPDGEATYLALLRGYTTPEATPEQVHEVGRAQQERLEGEWAEAGREAYGIDEPAEVRRRMASEAGPATAAEVQEAAEELHAAAEAAAPGWFRNVPDAACEVRTTEHGSLAFYSPPPSGGGRPGVAWFNVSDPGAWGAQLAATVFHEGIPGHHFQLALAREDVGLHELHRDGFLPAFGEGWALYVERVAAEMGLYRDARDRLGMLASDALRATRLVVDTGLHALGWTRQQAIDEMVHRTGLGVGECTAEVDRYIAYPGQATSYMTGRLVIEQLRDEAQQRHGDGFDLAAFHDVVLAHGMVSLPALREVVGAWAPQQ